MLMGFFYGTHALLKVGTLVVVTRSLALKAYGVG